MLKHWCSLLAIFFGISAVAWTQISREQLLEEPHYLDAQSPVYAKVRAEQVRDALEIAAVRNSAAMDFNAPVIRLYLPGLDNSALAIVDFDPPQLFDAQSKEITCDWERGGYYEALHSTEISFVAQDRTEIISSGRARGTGRIRYPLEIVVSEEHLGTPLSGDNEVEFDGPFVTYTDRNIDDLFFNRTRTTPIRAFDSQGRILEEHGIQTVTEGERTRRTHAFYGSVAQIQIDTITRWAEIAFSYELIAPPLLPESEAGSPASRQLLVPAGKISFTIVPEVQEPPPTPLSPPLAEELDSITRDFHAYLSILPPSPENEAALRQFIDKGANVNARDSIGRTSLYFVAVSCDRSERLRMLLEAGAEVNVPDENGITPLMLAEYMHCEENIRLLKDKGAK